MPSVQSVPGGSRRQDTLHGAAKNLAIFGRTEDTGITVRRGDTGERLLPDPCRSLCIEADFIQ